MGRGCWSESVTWWLAVLFLLGAEPAWAGTLLLLDPLEGSTSGQQDGGQFIRGGWQAPRQLVWDLGRTVRAGELEVEVTNWDPSPDSPQHRFDKQHIISLYEAPHGSPHQADGDSPPTCFFNIRTGAEYNGLFKFLSSSGGFGGRQENRNSPPAGPVDPARTYRIRVTWSLAGTVSVWLDDAHLTTHQHAGPLALRYLFLGTDNAPAGTYGPQHDVIYTSVRVVAEDEGGPDPDVGVVGDAGSGPEGEGEEGEGEALRFFPEADGWVDPGAPAANHGADPELRVGGDGRTSYFRFRVAGVGRTATAWLELHAINGGGGGAIHAVADNRWDEGGLTWQNRPGLAAVELDRQGRVEIGQRYSFNVLGGVPGDGHWSLAIRSDDEDGAGYSSREAAVELRPVLRVAPGGGEPPDLGPGEPPDLGPIDQGTSQPDQGEPPRPDQGHPVEQEDGARPPEPWDGGSPISQEEEGVSADPDQGPAPKDAGIRTPSADGPGEAMQGTGCNCATTTPPSALPPALLLLLGLIGLRRATPDP